jgi:hypothetical protein
LNGIVIPKPETGGNDMRKYVVAASAMVAAFFLTLSAAGQPPGQPPGGKGGKGGFGGGQFKGGKGQPGQPGGFGGGFRGGAAPGEVMPGFVQDQLKLSEEQKKLVGDLQKEVDGKLDKILTEDQKAQLKQMRERGPRGPGGAGGPGGGPGGPGRPGGPDKGPPPKRPNDK